MAATGYVKHAHSHTGDGKIHDEHGSWSFDCDECRTIGHTFTLRVHGTRLDVIQRLTRRHQIDRHS